MRDKTKCIGCRNNFYNGNNPYGVSECWSLKTAKMTTRFQLSTHTPMWIKEAYHKVRKPDCYHESGYVFLKAIPDYAKTAKERGASGPVVRRHRPCATDAKGEVMTTPNENAAERSAKIESEYEAAMDFLHEKNPNSPGYLLAAITAALAERDAKIAELEHSAAHWKRETETWNGLCVEVAGILGVKDNVVPFGDMLRETAKAHQTKFSLYKKIVEESATRLRTRLDRAEGLLRDAVSDLSAFNKPGLDHHVPYIGTTDLVASIRTFLAEGGRT